MKKTFILIFIRQLRPFRMLSPRHLKALKYFTRNISIALAFKFESVKFQTTCFLNDSIFKLFVTTDPKMSRNQLRKPTPIVRPASDRASSTLEDLQNPHSEHRWAPPKPVLQNLSRLSNSPIGTTSEPQPSTPNFKSLISEFLGTGKPQTANPSTSAIKFQFKTASSTGGALPPLPDESVFPKDGYEEVEENGQLFAEETEGEEIPETSSPKPTSSFMDLVPKSPFQSQRNPMPCPSAPKVPRLAVSVDPMPSDEISQQVERALKECGFEDGTQKEEQQPPTRKSFTQDIVTGLLNSQSDFFETQMGKGREEVPSAKTVSSVGTMTDFEEVSEDRGSPFVVENFARQKRSLQVIVANLNRSNEAIVKFMSQMQRSCSKTNFNARQNH